MRCTALLVTVMAIGGCAPGQRNVRDSFVTAGDKRLAEGKREQALANYDRAIRLEPDAASSIIEKRRQVALAIANDERAKARAAMDEQRFADAFQLLWDLDKGGAYGAGVGPEFFADDYERAATGLWQQLAVKAASARNIGALRAAARVAAAFPDGHWTHTKLAELRDATAREFRTLSERAAPDSFSRTFGALAATLVTGGEMDPSEGGRALRIALGKLYSVQRRPKLDSVSSCSRTAKALADHLTDHHDDAGDASEGRFRLEVAIRLDRCEETSTSKTRTGTEYYKETVPVEVERDTIVREEWGHLGGQVTTCQTDARGNCTGRYDTRATEGQKTYWLRKKKVKVTEYQEVTKSRDVTYDVTYKTLDTRGKVEVALVVPGETGEWRTVATQTHEVQASVTSPGLTDEEYREVAVDMFNDARLPELYALLRKEYIKSYLEVARDSAREGDTFRAAMAYLIARWGGHPGDDAKVYIEEQLGLDTATYDALIAGQPLFEPLPVVALELPEGEYTAEEGAYAEAIETRERRRFGSQLPGVDAGFRTRRSPLRALGTMGETWLMNSVELAVRLETQGVALSIGSQKLGGDTGGFAFTYTGRVRRDNGSAWTYGVSIGGEIREEMNQHTSIALLLGYQQPIGPVQLQLQIDPNLIQIFSGTGAEGAGSMHFTPVLGLLDIPLGPLFARVGGSYFIGGLEPLSFEAMLGARLILGE